MIQKTDGDSAFCEEDLTAASPHTQENGFAAAGIITVHEAVMPHARMLTFSVSQTLQSGFLLGIFAQMLSVQL